MANSTFCSDFGGFSGSETVVSGTAIGGAGGTRLGDVSGTAGATIFGNGAFSVISGRVSVSEGVAGSVT